MATVISDLRSEFTATVQGCYDDWKELRQNNSEDYRRGFYDGFREVVWMFCKAIPLSVREKMMNELYDELDAQEPMLS